jgi:maltose O-acetyltransferase
MSDEKRKMLNGELYKSWDPILVKERKTAKELCFRYNSMQIVNKQKRASILQQLLGKMGNHVSIEPPFYCDYGYNINLGDSVYMNHGCVLLDVNKIEIGHTTLFGPYVQVLTASHPLNPKKRLSWLESGIPIKIGNNVWIGGGAIICPGVIIGNDTTIGAGSVVTKDIPEKVLAVGNPCKIIKHL